MADLIFLSNESNDGHSPVEETFWFGAANASSAQAGAAVTSAIVGPMIRAGRVVDFGIAIREPALSASGFISGNVSANLFVLNGGSAAAISALTTLPSIAGPVAASAGVVPKSTNAGGGTSGVIDQTGDNFSAGDWLMWNTTVQSAASAAPGNTAVIALTGFIRVRYTAV